MTRPRHVLHVMNAASGGAAMTTLSLIRELANRDIESSIVCHDMGSADERAAAIEAVDGRATFVHLYWWNKKTRTETWKRAPLAARESLRTGWGHLSSRTVEQAAIRASADLIHTNTALTPEGAIVAHRRRLPHVWHVRELIGPGNAYRFRGEPRRVRSWLSGRSDRLVANSGVTADAIRRVAPVPVTVVENGLDLEELLDLPEPPGDPVIRVGMIANLTSRSKRHDLFLRAAAAMDEDLPVEFWLIGHDPPEDPYARKLHELASSLGLGSRVRFTGFLSEVGAGLADVDLLVHPTTQESFGRIAVEAMAAARPVVGADAGGISEIVVDGETGFLVGEDPAQFAAAIERLVRSADLRRAMGRAGQDRAKRYYSSQVMADKMVAVYEAAMRSRPAAALR